ncbi:unnamed protein product [Haemonchus placei]|uniref:PRELI/MSF1 domain-containing protein n=1 Tax=Haemonchus placei TaxID=6290 RepID=A0A0N4WIX9_HAEPC|nr:unnamed protein product [Haemonchus placei]
MAARLSHSIYVALRHKVNNKNVVIFSVFGISLNWIEATKVEKLHGVLIKNRVVQIRRIVVEIPATVRFGYVKTSDINPVDYETRGITKAELGCHMWWHGPSFIRHDPETWSEASRLFTLLTEESEEQVCLVAKAAEEPSTILDCLDTVG